MTKRKPKEKLENLLAVSSSEHQKIIPFLHNKIKELENEINMLKEELRNARGVVV